MSRIILSSDQDPRIPAFLERHLGVAFFPPFTTMGIEKDGEIIGGVLFNIYTGHDIHVSLAGSGWTRSFLRYVGQYLYDQLCVERFTAITEKQNVVDIVYRLGGRKEGVIRNHFGFGRDGIILGVLRDEYRYGQFADSPRSSHDRPGPGGV